MGLKSPDVWMDMDVLRICSKIEIQIEFIKKTWNNRCLFYVNIINCVLILCQYNKLCVNFVNQRYI